MVTRFQNNRGPALDYDSKGHWVAYKDYQSIQNALKEVLEMLHLPKSQLDGHRIGELKKQFLDTKETTPVRSHEQ